MVQQSFKLVLVILARHSFECYGRFGAQFGSFFDLVVYIRWLAKKVGPLKRATKFGLFENLVAIIWRFSEFPLQILWTILVSCTYKSYTKFLDCRPNHGWCVMNHRDMAP